MNKSPKRRFIGGFDGLRTLGVIGVIMYHLNPTVFSGGYLGVPIFFLISGYLITDHFFNTVDAGNKFSLGNFYVKRVRRLYPGLVFVLLASGAYIVLFLKDLLYHLDQIFVTNILNVYNWWQIFNGQSYFERFANNESPFTHLWTLSIEGQFYIVWPLLLLLFIKFGVKKSRIFGFAMIVSIASAILMAVLYQPGVDPSRVYYGTDTRLFSILLGCGLAIIWPAEKLKKSVIKSDKAILNIVGLLSFSLMVFMIFTVKDSSPFLYRGGMFIFSVVTCIFIAVVAHPSAIWDKILSNKLFHYIGARSYGLYLYQFPVMIFFEAKFKNIADHPVLYPVIEVILIFLITEFSYRFVERPLSKASWSDVKEFFKSSSAISRVLAIVIALICITGGYGVVKATTVPKPKANDSQLAQTIKKNTKNSTKSNKKALENIRKNKNKQDGSKLTPEQIAKYKKLAKTHPVNKEFEKYGLSQFDLQRLQDIHLTGVGDSVMADGLDNFHKLFNDKNVVIDAAVSRQLDASVNILQDYKDKGALAPNVMVGLGTNGPFTEEQLDQVMKLVGPKTHVFWINVFVPTRPWEKPVNELLFKAQKKYKNLSVIDWNGYAKGHPDWFYDDQVHPNPDGSMYYSSFVAKQILKDLDKK
ncbi:acyltransferase family protein [Companilactobacillus sp.]|jgi:peptidoglycan/LPS O-acetylase OafA/YrhL|uniref:acyltransferase family protein n=1 Tax=Companilactobacillus sp. TaxID=2767905 RepID=UPI0025C0D4B7|nr:acyltransferase family protein [Companilactobacillus sp.]MCH4008339.1 acetyltransferase [Companilactobacillus sp.]MCH4051482.1 acetyltransferase [Companilactobacillus sp.]MCH4076282.1 acetyltransferase [Companilactobacillus sp.]MCH4124857.1 acetyltransferase [Companilactobacillus sp.]MCH4131399.1 acetyltransferase [Companilactobacillus sp.]